MKINRTPIAKNKLLNLNIARAKTYKNTAYFIRIKNIEFNLKKALNVIYKYHITNKKITFILGPQTKVNNKLKHLLFKKTNHSITSEILWANSYKYSKNKLKLEQISDLIVIISQKTKITVLEKSYKTKLLTISLNNSDLTRNHFNYNIIGNFKFLQNQTLNNFFYSVLLSIFKKK